MDWTTIPCSECETQMAIPTRVVGKLPDDSEGLCDEHSPEMEWTCDGEPIFED